MRIRDFKTLNVGDRVYFSHSHCGYVTEAVLDSLDPYEKIVNHWNQCQFDSMRSGQEHPVLIEADGWSPSTTRSVKCKVPCVRGGKVVTRVLPVPMRRLLGNAAQTIAAKMHLAVWTPDKHVLYDADKRNFYSQLLSSTALNQRQRQYLESQGCQLPHKDVASLLDFDYEPLAEGSIGRKWFDKRYMEINAREGYRHRPQYSRDDGYELWLHHCRQSEHLPLGLPLEMALESLQAPLARTQDLSDEESGFLYRTACQRRAQKVVKLFAQDTLEHRHLRECVLGSFNKDTYERINLLLKNMQEGSSGDV